MNAARKAPAARAYRYRTKAAKLLLSANRHVDDKRRAAALFELASELYFASRFVEAIEPVLTAVSLADQEYGLSVLSIRARLLQGMILLNVLNFTDAAKAFVDARTIADEKGLALLHSAALNNLGILTGELGNYTASNEFFRDAVNAAKTAHDEPELKRKERIGSALANLTVNHLRRREFEQAVSVADEAIDLLAGTKEFALCASLATAHCSAAQAYLKLGKTSEAEPHAAHAVAAARASTSRSTLIHAEAVMALCKVVLHGRPDDMASLLTARDAARQNPAAVRSVLPLAAEAHEHQADMINAVRMHREAALHYRRLFLAADSQRRGLTIHGLPSEKSAPPTDEDTACVVELKRHIASEAALAGLALMAESPVDPSGRHVLRIAGLTALFARYIAYKTAPLEALAYAGLVHDVGMITIPPVIQLKPDRLDDAEKAAIRNHPIEGVAFLSRRLEHLELIQDVVRSHHERWDGRGYPDGLFNEAIPLEARLVALVDAFEVMTHGRPYFQPLAVKDALAEISQRAGTHFDPKLASDFVRFIENIGGSLEEIDACAIAWVGESSLAGYGRTVNLDSIARAEN